MSRDLLRESLVYHSRSGQYEQLESEVRVSQGLHIRFCHSRKNGIRISNNLIELQRKEISLLPRPVKLYAEVVDASERLIDGLAEIRVLRFSVPRKLTVFDMMPLRRELISAILVNLWALGQCFRSRSPLPQYLPSPRPPLESIMDAVDEHARMLSRNRHLESDAEGKDKLSILYGMAENEALAELCDTLDEVSSRSLKPQLTVACRGCSNSVWFPVIPRC